MKASFVSWLAVFVVVLSGVTPAGADCPEITVRDFQLRADTWTKSIHGTARNGSDTKFDWVELHFVTIDKNGDTISDPKAYKTDVKPRTTFNFKATVLSETVPVDAVLEKKICI